MDKLQDEIDHLARELQDEAEEKEARAARLAKPGSPKQRKKKRDPAEMTDAERARFDAQDRERWEASAWAIIDSDDVLALFARVWRKVVAGEEKNAKLLFLIGTSRLFKKCMSAAIKGPSSAGKSEIRRQVLEFFPPESVVSFTTLSEKALLYYQGDFAHKVLSMGEAAGIEEQTLQDYLLRELISEGRLRYPVVQKNKDAGLATVVVEKNGPVAFIVTTTKTLLNAENETRMTSLEVDDSDKQTTNVLGKVASIVGMNTEQAAIDYEPWRDFQRWLAADNCEVVVPFAERLASLIPPRSVRLRRDFTQILLAIKAHALLHRQQRAIDMRGQIVADIEHDYRAVAGLMGGILAEASGTSVAKEMQETIDAVAEATSGMAIDDGASSDKIAKLLKLDQSAAWRRLNKAAFKGFVVNLETRHRQPGRYRLTGQEVEAEELLPSPEALEAGLHTAQTCIREDIRQVFETLSECTSVCTNAPVLPEVASHPPPSMAEADTDLDDNIVAREERAAVLEYDGGLDRQQAEQEAAEEFSYPELPEFLIRQKQG